jgi:hypothetical protein
VLDVGTLRVEGLDVRFTVEYEDANFGKSRIDIFNLNETHRRQIEEQKTVEVSLFVGYADQDLGLICKTDMREAFSVRDGQDWVTKLSTGDGDSAAKARLSNSYPPGAKFETLWKDATKALQAQGIGVGNAIEAIKKGNFRDGITELLHGGNMHGQALKEMRRIGKSLGLDVHIQDKELVVAPINGALSATAVVLNSGTGLIGSPQRGAKGILKVRSLLLPGLKPKRLVQVESRLVTGTYVVRKAKFTGDKAANDWYADLECTEAA